MKEVLDLIRKFNLPVHPLPIIEDLPDGSYLVRTRQEQGEPIAVLAHTRSLEVAKFLVLMPALVAYVIGELEKRKP